jgi:hypothetical protein
MNTSNVLERLGEVEAAAHRHGWRQEPHLVLLHPGGHALIPIAFGWVAPTTAHTLTVNFVANLVASLTPGRRGPLPPHRAIQVLQQIRYTAKDSVAAAVLADGPVEDGRTVREVVAVDLAGNWYRLTRERGHRLQHMIEPPAARKTLIHRALRRMLTLTYQDRPHACGPYAPTPRSTTP